MSDMTLNKEKPKTTADYKALAAQMFAEVDRLEDKMDKSHAEGERLKTETQAIKAHTASTLAQLREQMKRLSETV